MPGEGHILAMIQSLRGNRSMLRRKSRFEKENRFLSTDHTTLKAETGKVPVKKVSQAYLLQIREKIRNQQKKEMWLTLMIGLVLFSIAGFYGVHLVTKENESKVITDREIAQETITNNKYLYYIMDGDTWFKQRKWHNAMFQYQKALALYPNDYDALFRLTMVLSYTCEETGTDCELGRQRFKKLIAFKPDDPALQALGLRFSNAETEP